MGKKLRLNEAFKEYEKKFKYNRLNIVNAPPCCGKTSFILGDFLDKTSKYIENPIERDKLSYDLRLSKILYVCDTTMLKDSVLSENDKITARFSKGSIIDSKKFNDLSKILNAEDNGEIKVMTYSSLGYYIKKDKSIITDNFNIIICDEIQNLFKYCKKHNRYKDEDGNEVFSNDGEYVNLIDELDFITKRSLVIGLTGTPKPINDFMQQYGKYADIYMIFSSKERKNLYTHNFEPDYTNNTFNIIKTLNYSKMKKLGFKMYIYTKTIRKSKEYKQWFTNNNIKAEWLCSVNNGKYNITVDEWGEVVKEFIPTMNDRQLELRKLLTKKYKEDEEQNINVDVLIVNGAYETGWNLKDKAFKICLIDVSDKDEQYQARHRIRQDIDYLCCLETLFDGDGYIYEKAKYGELVRKETYIGNSTYRSERIYLPKMKIIDDKYVGVKLTKALKDEIIFQYGIKGFTDKKVIWKTVKRDLINSGYIVKSDNNSTYIFRKNEELKKDSVKEVRSMNNIENLKSWILNEWDKKRITVSDIMDATDFGRKSFDKILENDEFNMFLKDNRIKIGTVKGLRKTKYMFKY